jgi:CubicO group peptidase (beta-lactamase class C family)
MRLARLAHVSIILSVIALLGAAPAPAPTTQALPRSTPEAQGISSAALLAFVEEAEQKLDVLHSFMLVRHGQVVAEGWWSPYAAAEPHMMFSLSKSFTSTAVGLAIADGKLTVEDPVLRFFPDEAPAQPSANLKAMRVRDLLTMSVGHHDEDIQNFPYNDEDSVVKKFLALPVTHKPGTFFVYNTPASYMLSAIVQKVTGQSVLEYLRPRLFDPLGIENPTWDASKQGISLGGFGLSIRTEDIARFGQLYLQKGTWHGKQIVPAGWVEDATSRHMSNGSSPTSDWEQGYGYQFWRCRHGFYRGDGAHGQFCIVMPQYDAVMAITSGTRDMASVMNLVWDRIVPALEPTALPADRAAHDKLTAKLGTLTLKPQTGAPVSTQTGTFAGKRYTFGINTESIEAMTLDAATAAGDVSFTVRTAGVDQQITASRGVWRKGTMLVRGVKEPIAASGGWTADDTYTMQVVRYHTPFAATYRLHFNGGQLVVDSEQNVGAADTRIAHFTGSIASAATAPSH